MTKVSQAAGKIAGFLITIVDVFDKLQIINPKREALSKAEKELQLAEETLAEKRENL